MLKPIQPGLRTIRNGSNGVAKASISVPVDDVLVVSDEVARQLIAATQAFKDVDAVKPAPVPEEIDDDVVDADVALGAEMHEIAGRAKAKTSKTTKS